MQTEHAAPPRSREEVYGRYAKGDIELCQVPDLMEDIISNETIVSEHDQSRTDRGLGLLLSLLVRLFLPVRDRSSL